MRRVTFICVILLQSAICFSVLGQQRTINLSDSATFYYQKRDMKKAFEFYEAYFSSQNSNMNNYSAYYAAVAACHAGNVERAKYYLGRSAEIGYDYLGYDEIERDSLNICLYGLKEWKVFITNYKNDTQAKLEQIRRITEGLSDTAKRVNASILSNPAYWEEYKNKHTADHLIEHIKSFNNFPSPKNRDFWTLYNIRVNDTLTVPFLLHIPKSYDAKKKTALYVYLHGGIANRTNFSTPANIPSSLEITVMDNPATADAFIIYPFGKKSFGWLYHQSAFTTILNEISMVKSFYNIDDNRVYVGGHSNGGSGAFWYAINQPSPFAAFFGLNYLPKIYSSNTPFRNLKNNAPFLGVSGSSDSVFPQATVNGIYRFAIEEGANWQNFNLNGGHTTTIENRDSIGYLFDTLASTTRNPFQKRIEWETDNVQNGRNQWIEITELDTLAEKALWHNDLNPTLTQQGKTDVVNFNKNKSGAVIATVKGNIVDIQTSRVKSIKFYVSPDMFDMANPLKVVVNGREFINSKITPDKNVIIDEFLRMKDRVFIVANIIELTIR